MDFKNHSPPQLTVEAAAQLQEGIGLVLSRWTALQMAVLNDWGDHRSKKASTSASGDKSQDLAVRIFSFFTESKEMVYIDDLEEILYDFMLSDFNTEVEDGSIEEVAEKLMVMHEQCTEGNFESINELKRTIPGISTVSYRKQGVRAGEEEDDGDVENDMLSNESSDMAVDSSYYKKSMGQTEAMVDEPIADTEQEDGWTVVSSKRSNGRRK